MEEAETEDELAELLRLDALLEEVLLIGDGVHQVRAVQVRLETLGGFVGHLDTVLQDRDGEGV